MKKQVLLIHGGNAYSSYEEYLDGLKKSEFSVESLDSTRSRWNRNLDKLLGDGFEVIMPQMPCKQNARYAEWKIWFEKIIPFLRDGVVLIGHSLGGIFLAKYLAENDFPVKIAVVYSVAAPFNEKDRGIGYSLGDFALPESLQKFQEQVGKIFLYHSEDDPTVPIADLEKYAQALPKAEKTVFQNHGHFMQEHFPEIVEVIKSQ